jgi:hypothetical protein
MPKTVEPWSLTSLRAKLIKIGAKIVRHGRYAVTEVCLPQLPHSQVQALVCSCHALLLPQPRHTKPSGQRAANRYPTQATSSAKRCWNSINERGKSVIGVTGAA